MQIINGKPLFNDVDEEIKCAEIAEINRKKNATSDENAVLVLELKPRNIANDEYER